MENNQEITKQKEALNKVLEQNQQQKPAYNLRLDALNLKIEDPKNPEGTYTQSLVNGINALDDLPYNIVKDSKWTLPITASLAIAIYPLKIIPAIAKVTDFALGGVANLSHKIPRFGDKGKIKPNDFGDWEARKENTEKQAKDLGELKETGKLLEEIEGKYKDNGLFKDDASKAEFAKSAVNILSNDNNQDLLEAYLENKGLKEEITKAITAVNEAKHILLTGEGCETFKATNTKPEENNKEFIEFLGYKTKGETNLMSAVEIAKTMGVLKKDFGMTLGNDGKITHTKLETQSENYKKELKTANNINDRLEEGAAGKFNYSEQNKESEEQKDKEKAENNKNYSRTSTGDTKQSGMSPENMAGNATVLGGAIASAAVIPFVGWIVALAILYSFKDKFKDDPEKNKEFEDAARLNGLKDEQLQKLKDEVAQLKERESKNETTPQDDIIKYLGKNPNDIKEITDILKKPNNQKELKEFLMQKLYNGEPTNKQKEAINNLTNSGDADKTVNEIIKNIQQNQKNFGENAILKGGDKNNTQTIYQR